MNRQIAALYCRLSSEDLHKDPKKDSQSIQNQKLLLQDYALKNNFEIFKIYCDDDYSGLDCDRPAFNSLISDAKKGLFNIIICKNQSRFTRDMELVEKYIHGLFSQLKIRFISILDNVDTNVTGNKKARQIYGLVNEWYSEDLSFNIRLVFQKKRESGQFIGSFAPYGYKKLNKNQLAVDLEASEVVEKIYNLYMQGFGCKKIADYLTSNNVKTPTKYKLQSGLNFKNPNSTKFSMNYGIWSKNTIRTILTNRMYVGDLVQGKEKKASYKSNKIIHVPKNEWVIVENTHEPIIDRQIFFKVQTLICSKKRIPKKNSNINYLSGKIKCLNCNNTMQKGSISRNNTNFYLRCVLAHKSKKTYCTTKSISYLFLENIICEQLNNYICNFFNKKDLFDELLKIVNNNKIIKKPTDSFEKKISDIDSSLLNCYKDKLKGIITQEIFLQIKQELEEEKILLLSKLSKSDNTPKYSKNDIINFFKITKLNHVISNYFIKTIKVNNKNIEIFWNF